MTKHDQDGPHAGGRTLKDSFLEFETRLDPAQVEKLVETDEVGDVEQQDGGPETVLREPGMGTTVGRRRRTLPSSSTERVRL